MYIFQESELGLEDQAIIKKGNKLYLVLSEIFDEAKRRNPDKLRMYVLNHFCKLCVCMYNYVLMYLYCL